MTKGAAPQTMDATSATPTPSDAQTTRLDLQDIRARLAEKRGQAYWRSLEELAETPEFEEFLHKEFPRQAAPMLSAVDRRGFIKLLGASLALAGLTSCVRPYQQEKILPYVRAPEELIPGVPNFYASALTEGGYAKGVLVESHQGRPTKIEGNPDHPASLGATDAQMQAATLALYDPDRSQVVRNVGNATTFSAFVEAATAALNGLQGGAGLHILTETVTSPTLARQLAQLLQRYPQAQWHQFDPLWSAGAFEGARLAFGEDVAVRYDFAEADVILSLDADFLGEGPGKLAYSRAFSDRRRVHSAEDTMNRLYVVEGVPTITGGMADHRLALRPSRVEALARALAARLGVAGVSGELPEGVPEAWFEAVVEDLQNAGGRCVVVPGDAQGAAVHVLAHAINAALGSVGTTVFYTDPVVARPENQLTSLQGLVERMRAGSVQALLILGGNPVYTAPSELGFAEALANVPFSAHLSLYFDETSARTTWHVPMTHELEAWSDARAFDGTASIMQPLIEPFYNGVSPHELLAALLGDPEATAYAVVRATYEPLAEGGVDSFWRQTVYAGVINGTRLEPKEVSFRAGALQELPAAAPVEGLELAFRLDPNVLDGRYANNGWLQELPKPFSKLTWDNAALVAPALAERQRLSNGDLITLGVDGRSLEVPIWIMPGQADGLVVLHLGYGREYAGRIGNGAGFNSYLLRTSAGLWHTGNVQLSRARGSYRLVSTALHHALDTDGVRNRHIIRHGTLEELKAEPEHPHFVHPVAHHASDLYPDWTYEGRAWAMVVDMNVCTGCNACITACQAENNIPIVGKREVGVGREMHWIRVDAYFGGSVDDPEFYHQPMMCQHCEKAPCEPVCPVAATVHDNEGLNVMVYNRCVGTRYCSNNCPYKVRRFNFLQYAELDENSLAMLANPNVTVRSRGVMEKCTYCLQRIKAATIRAGNENRPVRDGEIVTACEAACPTNAIVFGDMNDPESRVAQLRGSVLNYSLLDELNTHPRTTYLAKLTNPHPALSERATGAH